MSGRSRVSKIDSSCETKDGSSSKSKGKRLREGSEWEEGVSEEGVTSSEDLWLVVDILIVWICFDVARVNNGILVS